MKKLHLDVDQLAVESFATAATARTGGTVRGHDATELLTCANCNTQNICPTNYESCDGDSCIDSCGGSCGCPTLDGSWTCGLC